MTRENGLRGRGGTTVHARDLKVRPETAVDLRAQGDAFPLVDELAAVELDIRAQEQGLTKLRTNVLGLEGGRSSSTLA